MLKKTFCVLIFVFILFTATLDNDKQKNISYDQPKSGVKEYLFPYQDYSEIIDTFEDWNKDAPNLV
jgi:hypothetical protein